MDVEERSGIDGSFHDGEGKERCAWEGGIGALAGCSRAAKWLPSSSATAKQAGREGRENRVFSTTDSEEPCNESGDIGCEESTPMEGGGRRNEFAAGPPFVQEGGSEENSNCCMRHRSAGIGTHRLCSNLNTPASHYHIDSPGCCNSVLPLVHASLTSLGVNSDSSAMYLSGPALSRLESEAVDRRLDLGLQSCGVGSVGVGVAQAPPVGDWADRVDVGRFGAVSETTVHARTLKGHTGCVNLPLAQECQHTDSAVEVHVALHRDGPAHLSHLRCASTAAASEHLLPVCVPLPVAGLQGASYGTPQRSLIAGSLQDVVQDLISAASPAASSAVSVGSTATSQQVWAESWVPGGIPSSDSSGLFGNGGSESALQGKGNKGGSSAVDDDADGTLDAGSVRVSCWPSHRRNRRVQQNGGGTLWTHSGGGGGSRFRARLTRFGVLTGLVGRRKAGAQMPTSLVAMQGTTSDVGVGGASSIGCDGASPNGAHSSSSSWRRPVWRRESLGGVGKAPSSCARSVGAAVGEEEVTSGLSHCSSFRSHSVMADNDLGLVCSGTSSVRELRGLEEEGGGGGGDGGCEPEPRRRRGLIVDRLALDERLRSCSAWVESGGSLSHQDAARTALQEVYSGFSGSLTPADLRSSSGSKSVRHSRCMSHGAREHAGPSSSMPCGGADPPLVASLTGVEGSVDEVRGGEEKKEGDRCCREALVEGADVARGPEAVESRRKVRRGWMKSEGWHVAHHATDSEPLPPVVCPAGSCQILSVNGGPCTECSRNAALLEVAARRARQLEEEIAERDRTSTERVRTEEEWKAELRRAKARCTILEERVRAQESVVVQAEVAAERAQVDVVALSARVSSVEENEKRVKEEREVLHGRVLELWRELEEARERYTVLEEKALLQEHALMVLQREGRGMGSDSD